MPPSAFIGMIAAAAQDCQRKTGVLASITIAQAALESGWGMRSPGFNLFGIKADKSWTGPTVDFATTEYVAGKPIGMVAKFRRYSSWQESMIDHAKFLLNNPRYAACFKQTTGEGWARAVAAAGYATDPLYADNLLAVIRGRNLTTYDLKG